MINASAAFVSALQQSSRKFNARLLDNGTALDIAIRRLTVYKGSCGSTSFAPGAVYVPYIDATADHYGQALKDKRLQLQIGVMTAGTLAAPTYDYITLGFFTVKNVKSNSRSTTFTAYGQLQNLEEELFYVETVGTSSLTIQNVLDRIETLTGITITVRDNIDTSAVMSAFFFTKAITGEISCRDALASAALVAGGYATETADGNIVVCKYTSTVTAQYTAADTMTAPPEVGDDDTVITGVQVYAAGGVTYTQGIPVNLKVTSMDMSETAFPAFANNLIGLTYRGGDVSLALGDPRLEPWDVMRITDTDNTQYVIPCMYLAIIYDGGLQTRCTAPAIASIESSKLDKALQKANEATASVEDLQPELIVGTHGTTATAAWTGTSTVLTELKTGTRIQYKLSSAGASNVTLNLALKNGTTTGAKPVYYLNTTRLSTQYAVNAVIDLIYDGDAWRVLNPYKNDNTVGTYGGAVTAGSNGVKNYSLVMKDTKTTWVSLTTSGGTGTSKQRYTGGLYPDNVMYMGSNSSYAAGATTGNCYEALGVNLNYSTNSGSTLIARKPVYLVGEIHSDGLFYLDSTWWTQTEPTTEDGKTYIYLGLAYSTSNVYLVPDNTLYRYYEGAFRTVAEIEQIKAARTATNYLASDTTGIMVANLADGHTYTPSTVPAGVKNAFIDSDTFKVRDGQTVLASYGTEAAIYTTDGTELAHFGYASGTSASGTSVKPYYTLGKRASGSAVGNWSAAFGNGTEASGFASAAFGSFSVASGYLAIATGSETEASGNSAISAGAFTVASGNFAAAVGIGCEAKQYASTAIGYYTIANDAGQFVCGCCNVEDTDARYAVIVGGGPDDTNRKNIYTVTWDGDTELGVDTTAAAGTVDGDLYRAITTLGWDSDVIDSDMISVKKLLTKILQRL